MPLTFQPSLSDILICNYETGFIAPEMVEKRPVLVISPRRRTIQLVTVVPLSSTAPRIVEPWHVPVPPGLYPPARAPMWAKADMIATVAVARLDRVRHRASDGVTRYQVFRAEASFLAAVRAAVKAALALA